MSGACGANRQTQGDPLVGRAIRLFEFLGRAQQLRNQPPHTVDAYRAVLWLGDLPDHPAVTAAHRAGPTTGKGPEQDTEPDPDAAVLSIDRVSRIAPPEPDEAVASWLTGRWDDPDRPPELRAGTEPPAVPEAERAEPSEPPEPPEPSGYPGSGPTDEVRTAYQSWRARWRAWAEQELRDRPVRAWYGQLFAAYVSATGNPEDLELVVGVGCLAWTPPDHPAVRRHLVTAPATIRFDDDTGRLTVHRLESSGTADVELDMLDPGLVPTPKHVAEIRREAKELRTHPLHRAETASLVRRVVHTLDADGEYRDDITPAAPAAHAVATYSPAVILRRRSHQGVVEIFRTIVDQLTESGRVPDGLLPLLDPDHEPAGQPDRTDTDGALVSVGSDEFGPLPVNDVQLRIIHQVDAKAQTLVQGPPGTGKTHTAAALLSHLLAKGKRVLVTAHTDRALREVRDKLPAAIKPLSVAVVGSSREDMSDLKVAVERIAAAAAEHDPVGAQDTILAALATIDELGAHRADLHDQLVRAREHEVREHEHAGYRGTLAAIATRLAEQSPRFGWLREHLDSAEVSTVGPATPPAPLDNDEITEWLGYRTDAALAADEPEALAVLADPARLPRPHEFAELVRVEHDAAMTDRHFTEHREHAAFDALRGLDAAARGQLRHRLHELADEADDLARRGEGWMSDAVADVRAGRARGWHERAKQITALVRQADTLVTQLGPLTTVEITRGANVGALVHQARSLAEHLRTGSTIRTNPDGTPRLGALTAKAVKQAQPLFTQVLVDGLPPTNRGQVGAFLAWVEIWRVLAALDTAWPAGARPVEHPNPRERLRWHSTELDQLHRVLRLAEALDAEQRRLTDAGLPRPQWTDLDAVRQYANLADVAAAADALDAATEPLRAVERVLARPARDAGAAPCVPAMLNAVRDRDPDAYAQAHARLTRLTETRSVLARRDELAERLSTAAPRLRAAVEQDPDDPRWAERLAGFTDAWAWMSAGAWVLGQAGTDVNAVQAEIDRTEDRIRREIERLAATRAWGHAVAPDRLTGQARANLEHYAYLVRRLGKGTGRYAAQRRAEVREAMDRCRPAVPVWIMPVYRIAEQLQIQPDMFDVVIVDEASQAGLEATFLQYLARRMVVIGDDKQVSPSAVGIDQQRLRDLAGQYLADDPYRSAWQDPQRSLFDEAKMRYRGLLTLTEHRRCVPEIIAFSNRVAYEPDGVRLVPVRQYGADRLEPIRVVYLPDGHVQSSTNKVNPVEVDAIAEQLEKCVTDPRYDGLTFGVISLLGGAQAKAIERTLLERIAPEDWAARRLQCGDSADFQGAERDVMFLSMVAAPTEDSRQAALTRELFVQRYNVAASRARDQMWLFHSVPHTGLDNPEDMRAQLLDHCYGVLNRRRDAGDGSMSGPVPDDVRTEPFDSLFSQRVANRLVERGYAVVPRHTTDPADPHPLDLVVVGAATRLAVLCEGDTWRGAEAYERELAHQRDLARCGWRLHRIRESAFYTDPESVLGELEAALRELDIQPRLPARTGTRDSAGR